MRFILDFIAGFLLVMLFPIVLLGLIIAIIADIPRRDNYYVNNYYDFLFRNRRDKNV